MTFRAFVRKPNDNANKPDGTCINDFLLLKEQTLESSAPLLHFYFIRKKNLDYSGKKCQDLKQNLERLM